VKKEGNSVRICSGYGVCCGCGIGGHSVVTKVLQQLTNKLMENNGRNEVAAALQ